jgi:FAD synthetase
MSNKIVTIEQAADIVNKIKRDAKTVVLAGGCFDLLHVGHIKFLQAAKKQGDYLFILLENDNTVSKLKGPQRPINIQSDRAEILAAFSDVDYIVTLTDISSNDDYDNIVLKLKPDFIAATQNDPQIIHKQRQAALVNAKVVFVTERIKNKSTTTLTKIIAKKYNK